MPCCRANIRIIVPIIIGTVPIQEDVSASREQSNTNMPHSSRNNVTFYTNDGKIFEYIFTIFTNQKYIQISLAQNLQLTMKIYKRLEKNSNQNIQCSNVKLFIPKGAE